MLYEKALKDKRFIKEVIGKIAGLNIKRRVKIMEVCGTHTYTFFRYGLKGLLFDYVDFVSGPGCPVCITTASYIDKAVALTHDRKNIVATFGDLLRVKGSASSLDEERSRGGRVEVVYSPYDALTLARRNKKKRVIFLAVGFETTAPAIAATVKEAYRERIKNFFILCGNRLIPPAMDLICGDKELLVEGFICPGHVSAIIGTRPYRKIVDKFKRSCVICGFEPVDIVVSLYILLKSVRMNEPVLENTYRRLVRPEGNRQARVLMDEVFEKKDAAWRGIGVIKKSGLFLRGKYHLMDGEQFLPQDITVEEKMPRGCRCGEVIIGKIKPYECPQFRRACSPQNPLGPCMVSFEGACRIYYEYRGDFDRISG